MYDDPQLVARGYYQELGHARTGNRRYPGWPVQFSFASEHHRRGAPTLGEHNHEILTEELGLTDEDIEALTRDGIIGDRMQAPG
jgi:crotonobetainyl-CoA:carnitine CoA-transferase CaiB-like acyl-CoA transferase